MSKKNTWAQKILNNLSLKGASETIKNKAYTYKQNKKTKTMRGSLTDKLLKNTRLSYSNMGDNYGVARKNIDDLMKKGNFKGAKQYISEQDRKIRAQFSNK